MVHTVSKMAGQLKNIEIQMSVLMKEVYQIVLECSHVLTALVCILQELTRVKSQVP